MKNLVIVESPTKARTLSQFLGGDYKITASMGHVRDLPRGEFGVDVEHDFEPKYVIPKEKIKSVNILAKEAASAQKIWLATSFRRFCGRKLKADFRQAEFSLWL